MSTSIWIMAFDLLFDRVEVPTEKRAKRWAISIEDLVTDLTGNYIHDLSKISMCVIFLVNYCALTGIDVFLFLYCCCCLNSTFKRFTRVDQLFAQRVQSRKHPVLVSHQSTEEWTGIEDPSSCPGNLSVSCLFCFFSIPQI